VVWSRSSSGPDRGMKRVLTALVAIPLVVLIVLFSPDWIFALVAGLVCAFAVDEFLSLGEKKGIGRPGRWFLLPAALVTVSFIGGPSWVLSVFALTMLALLAKTTLTQPLEGALGRASAGLASVAYCSMSLGFLLLIQRDFLFVLFAIIWVGDSAAYYGGRALGRHSLAPKISPKKTVEGAVAGLIGSLAAGIAMGAWLLGEQPLHMAGPAVAVAIAGQLGDLIESAMKRSAGVKDSSSILPGHGGILDRLDSLFFAAPVFYWFFNT
jgi:phosphatidate cytidylyltransferase